jgi:hypothetical protein
MPKFRGHEVEVRIATSEEGLATAPAIPYISSVEWEVDQGIESTPKGIGHRTQEVHEGLIEITGSIERDYDETAVAGSDTFAQAVGAYETGQLTPLYIEIKNKTTGSKDVIKRARGTYSRSVDVDGYVTETWDFTAEEVARGTGS